MSDFDLFISISTMNTNTSMHDISPGGKCYQTFICLQRQRKRMRSSSHRANHVQLMHNTLTDHHWKRHGRTDAYDSSERTSSRA